jgi:hypothetical protein
MFRANALKHTGLVVAAYLCIFTAQPAMANPNEWSDITPITGKYSLIYIDWVVSGTTGTFYCINDWMVNQDDNDVNGGLLSNEYNRFNFVMDGNSYEIRIYPNGTGQIYKNGAPATLNNFRSACSWTTSPNLPTVNHTIWEWAFDVMGTTTTTTQWVGCDPQGPSIVVVTNPPNPPSVLNTGPSAYPHYIDGKFADAYTVPTLPPVPSRSYQNPNRDPWFDAFDNGWGLTMGPEGGVTIRTGRLTGPTVSQWGLIAIGLALLTVGVIAIARRKRLAT